MYTLGDKIRRLRKKDGLSQEELAFRVGVTRQTVSLWESDNLAPKSDKLKLLCEIFKVSSDYLLFNDGEEVALGRDISNPVKDGSANVNPGGVSTVKSKYIAVKIAAAALITSLLLLVALICIMQLTTPSDGVETVTSVSFYFDPKIMLGLVIASIIIFIISIVLLIISIIKVKKRP